MADFEWDPAKAASNYAKHSVHFADAVGVFNDDFAITIEDTSTNEERFKTLGMDFLGRILVVVYTYRGDTTVWSPRAKQQRDNEPHTREHGDEKDRRFFEGNARRGRSGAKRQDADHDPDR